MKNRKAILTVLTSLALLAALGLRAQAQSAPAPPDSAAIVPDAEQAPPPPPPGRFLFKFRSIDESFDGKVVTGVPYSADAVTERTQVLADGNRIVQKTTAHLARDSQGRTRREQTLGEIGPWGAPADLPPMTMINDPVAGVHFVLDARRKIAFKHPLGDKGISFAPDGGKDVVVYRHHEILNPPGPEASDRTSTQISLGTQTIEGVQAQGTRKTVTIAAGAIGNDQPIQIVTERWYSPELQTVVMTKHSDPRFGDSVYRLTNISRDEPAPSLFEVPPDYTVKEGPGNVVFRRKLGDK